MTEAEKAQAKKWVNNWKVLAPILEKMRDEDIRAADTAAMIQSSNLLFRDAVKNFPPGQESGLIEQQRWFMKLHCR